MKTAMQNLIRLKRPLDNFLLALTVLVSIEFAVAQEYDWAPNFPVGSSIITISAQDQNGAIRAFDDLAGEKGLLFMLSRSFDW
jgi:4-hydroxybenzoate polyprenyltransferase|tara:strand:+ start:210 stop:458 length:249 start_codon:yes stop_codon:yes gene_type:complete